MVEFLRKPSDSNFEPAKSLAKSPAEFGKSSSAEEYKGYNCYDHQMCRCKQFTHDLSFKLQRSYVVQRGLLLRVRSLA